MSAPAPILPGLLRLAWPVALARLGIMLLVSGIGLLRAPGAIGRAFTANLELAATVSGLIWLAALILSCGVLARLWTFRGAA